MTSFRVNVGCSGNGELITADELFQVLIMILPEAEIIKNAFIKWVSLPNNFKVKMENRLESLTTQPGSLKDMNLHKGYSFALVLLRVFSEWNSIQDKYGAPGIQSGFTSVSSLPKTLELDIAFMMRCVQLQLKETLEFVVRDETDARRRFLSRMSRMKTYSKYPIYKTSPKSRNSFFLSRLSLSDSQMSMCGDHTGSSRKYHQEEEEEIERQLQSLQSQSDGSFGRPVNSSDEEEEADDGDQGSSQTSSSSSTSTSESGSGSQTVETEEESGAFDGIDCEPELTQFYSENTQLLQYDMSQEED